MIEGVLRHDTDAEIDRAYVDSHGQSEVAFAFCKLLGFQLLPRLKAIAAQRLGNTAPRLPEKAAGFRGFRSREAGAASWPFCTASRSRGLDDAGQCSFPEFLSCGPGTHGPRPQPAPMPHVSPGRITHRTAGGWPKDCQQAWAPPSGEATFSTLSHGIGRQTLSISRPSFRSGRTQSLTGRQSLSSQHEMPLRLRRPVYQPCAPAGTAVASRTKRMRPARIISTEPLCRDHQPRATNCPQCATRAG